MKTVVMFCFLGIVISCQTRNGIEGNRNLELMISYLRENAVDSTIIRQRFFGPKIKENHKSTDAYLLQLVQLQQMIKSSTSVDIGQAPHKLRYSVDNSDCFFIRIHQREKMDSIFVLVDSEGVESFSYLIKGGKIVAWF